MANRFHLGSIDKPEGTIWFTLVFESPSQFFVEQYNDSKHSFIRDRLRIIKAGECGRYQVNGVSLTKLVRAALDEIENPKDGQELPVAV